MADENAKQAKKQERVRKNAPKDRRRSRPSERALTRMGLDKQEAAYKKRRENVAFEIKAKRKTKESEKSPQRIKEFWRGVQKRQAEEMKKAKVSTFPAKISHVRIVTNREGEEVVKVSFAGGGSMQDTGDRIRMIHDIHRKTPSPDKIYLLMMAVKEKGWKAVEGSIPPELRDEVLKACAQAGVSLTAAETKKETVVQKSVSADRGVFYGDAENKSQNGMPAYKPLPVFDFRNIDAKRPYAVNDNVVQSREVWKKYAKMRSDNACEVLGLKGGDAQAYLDAVDAMQAHKDEWTRLRKSGQLTPEMEEAFKKKNDELAREEAYALAVASGLKTPEEIEVLRKLNLPSESPEMRDLWQLRDVAQLGTKEQAQAFLNGDRSMMKEINDKNRALKAQNDLEEKAGAMGVPVPRTPEEKNRLNRDFKYWQNLRRTHDNDMNAVKQEFQKYLMMSEKEKKAERSRLAQEVEAKNRAQKEQAKQAQKQAELASKTEITYASNEPREAVMVKMNFMEAALENPQDEAFADMNKALKELGVRSVEDFYDEKKMTKALQIGQKAYGREVWNAVREAKGQSPLSEEAWQKRAKPAKENQAREQVAPLSREIWRGHAKFAKENQAREEAYALAIASGLKTPEEIEALRKQNLPSKSKQMQELFDLRDVTQLGTKEQARAFLNGDRSMMKEINDKNSAQKAQSALEEKAAAMGVPVPQTPEERKELNRDFEYWQNLRRANGNDMNAVKQGFAKYRSMDDTAQKAERSRLAQEVEAKNSAQKAQAKQAQKQAEPVSKTEITYTSDEPQEAVIVKMSFMKAALENPQDEAFADMNKALKELGVRSVEDFYDEKKMTKALQIGKKAYGQEAWNAVCEAVRQSNEQKAQSALEEKAAAMGLPVPQTPEERKELNRDFEYWQNLRRANGNDMNAVKQGFAKYRSMDDTAQKAERMRLAEEVAVKNKASAEKSAEKPKAKESTLSLMQKVGRPHEMSLAEKMRARGQAEDREEIAERLERMKSRTREQTPAQRKSDRGAQMDRYVHDMQGRA